MLAYLTYSQIDFKKWDSCIDASTNGMIYGLSWYLDIVSPGWAAIIKEERGEYQAVMPIPCAKKFGFSYVKQPVFAQQLGVFWSAPLVAAEWQEIAAILSKQFRFITRYEFNTTNEFLLEVGLLGLAHKKFTTHHINLNSSYQQIAAGYKKARRWRINKAKRSGLLVEKTNEIDVLIELFDANVADRIYGVVGEEYEYKILRQLYQAANTRNMVTLYKAVDTTGAVLAMIMLFIYKEKIIYIFNASDANGKREGAIPFLLDYVMKTYAGQNLCFDFESPEVANVSHFYASFGAEEASFASVAMNNLPGPINWLKSARTKAVRYFTGKSK